MEDKKGMKQSSKSMPHDRLRDNQSENPAYRRPVTLWK